MNKKIKPSCLCDDIKGGHSIDCDYYKPSWEEEFLEIYKDVPPSVLAMMLIDFRQTIKQERAEAVREVLEKIKNGEVNSVLSAIQDKLNY